MRTWGCTLVLFFIFGAASAHAQDAYQAEYQRAIQGVLNNMQSNGAIVASPSQQGPTSPNYTYDWIRDTSVTMKSLVQLAYDAQTPAALKQTLLAKINVWINWELNRQITPTISGLGEPRFYLSGKASFEDWGRPQNDGPALRALTAILIANHWIQEGRMADVNARLYRAEIPANTMIKRDLEYVAHHWTDLSVDLWEEEKAMHFYTLTVQRVALLKGAVLANQLGDGAAGSFYASQAAAIQNYLGQFYDPKTQTIRYALNQVAKLPQKTTDLDISIILAAIQTYDGQFYVNTTQVAQTLNALVLQFNSAYSINRTKKSKNGVALGVATGRYPGDVYSGYDFSGGNPWFLSTLAVAEFWCDVNRAQNIAVATSQFNQVLYHMNPDGALSEQFSRNNGYEQGARDLTWSYTSYVSAYRACFGAKKH